MRFVSLLVVGLWLFIGSPAAADGSGGSVEGRMNPVVESYARDYVVSYGEAERRLGRVGVLQEVMASIRALEHDRLAGWGIDHGERFTAWVWLTGDEPAGAAVAEIVAGHDDVEIRTGAVHSYAELRAAQDRFDLDVIGQAMVDAETRSRILGMVVLTGVDMGSNSVGVSIDPSGGPGRVWRGSGDEPTVVSDETFEAAADWLTGAAQDYLGVGVTVTDGRGFGLHADFMGGEEMSSCTAGFAAKHSKGHYGLISAGHCPDRMQLHGIWLDQTIGRPTRRADAQFHRIPAGDGVHTLTDDFKCHLDDSGGVCDVTGTIERNDMMGDYVCHNILIGGMSCGEVTDITSHDFFSVCQDEDGDGVVCDPVFVIVKGESLKLCKGDSGGPWYNHAGIAYGIHSGGAFATNCVPIGERWAVFSAIKEVEAALDVKVLTEDPTAPSAVTNLTASVDLKGVTLSWDPPVEGAWRSIIYRRIAKPGEEYSEIYQARNSYYLDSAIELTPSLEYEYKIIARNNLGMESDSRSVIATAPVSLQVAKRDNIVKIRWEYPVEGISHYDVYRRVAQPGHSYTKIATVKSTAEQAYEHSASDLITGIEYYYQVKAVTNTGVVRSWGSGPINYARIVVPAAETLSAVLNSRSAVLSWDQSYGDVKSYDVYRRVAQPGYNYTKIATVPSADKDHHTYEDPVAGLTPGVEYYYRLKGISTTGVVGGWGLGSDYASLVVPAIGGLMTTGFSDGVRVSWDVPDGDVASYKVYRRVAKPGHPYVEVADRKVPYHWDPLSGLKQETEYYYRIKTVSTTGVVGAWGPGNNYASWVVPAVQGLKAEEFSDGVRVSWDIQVGDVASYKVYRRVARPGEFYVEVADRKVPYYWDSLSGLTPGVEYYYRIKAVSTTGKVSSWGTASNYVSATVPAVQGLRAEEFSDGVRVSWDIQVGDVASYKVYRRVARPGEFYVEVADRKVPYYWDSLSDLTPGVEYYYRIKAVSTTGVVGSWGPGYNYVSLGVAKRS